MEQPKVQKVAFYIRVSTEDQAEKFGVVLQKESLLALCRSRGDLLEFAGEEYVYVDDGISGTIDINDRPAFARLKEAILYSTPEDRPFDTIAVFKIDRFARRLKILLDVVEFFEKYDISFISANESIDTSTPFGKAILGIMGVIAELELETTKLRTSEGRKVAAKEGVPLGNAPKYGYKKDERKHLVLFEKEAKVVREIFRMYAWEGSSFNEIAQHLRGNYPSPQVSSIQNKATKIYSARKNKPDYWQPNAIKRILLDEVYTGILYYNKSKDGKAIPRNEWKVSDNKHEAIIDAVTFQKTKERYEATKQFNKNYGRNKGHVYLLSGILKCADCYDQALDQFPASWIGEPKNIKLSNGATKTIYSYKCKRRGKSGTDRLCNTIPLPADQVEEYVLNIVKKIIRNPKDIYEYKRQLQSSKAQVKQLKTRANELRKLISGSNSREENILYQHREGMISGQKMKTQVSELKKSVLVMKKELSDIEGMLGEDMLGENYLAAFKTFKNRYENRLEDLFEDREELSRILKLLISDIIVFSRPVKKEDSIAGQKKSHQRIPYKMFVKFRLPAEMMRDMMLEQDKKYPKPVDGSFLVTPVKESKRFHHKEFGVDGHPWCQGAGSNRRHLALQASALPAELP